MRLTSYHCYYSATILAGMVGFEPTTNGLTVRCATAAPHANKYLLLNYNKLKLICQVCFGGSGEIRTHGGITLDGFQDHCNQPLCHASIIWHAPRESDPASRIWNPTRHLGTLAHTNFGSGYWNCTSDLQLMRLPRYYFSNPQLNVKIMRWT